MLDDEDPRVIYLQPPRSRFPWGWLVFSLVLLAFLGLAFRMYLVHVYMDSMASLGNNLRSSLSRPVVIPSPPPPVYTAGASPAFPPSARLRLSGQAQSKDKRAYIATSASGEYVLIPAASCTIVDGGPVCHYQGKTVTRYTGSP